MNKLHIYTNKSLLDKDRYDWSKLLSYKRQLSIVVGDRRNGKTFRINWGVVKYALEIEDIGFIRGRITKDEMLSLVGTFMDDTEKFDIFPNYIFSYKGRYIYAKRKDTGKEFPIGYLFCLKNAVLLKGIPFPNVKYLVIDEWMEESQERKCKNKVNLLWSIIYSIFALRKIRVILISNAVTINDPIFKKFKITDINRPFTKGETYVIENTNYEEKYDKFRKKAKESDFGKLIKGDDYENFALNNKFMLDDYSNIDNNLKSKGSPFMSIRFSPKLLVSCYAFKDTIYFIKVKTASVVVTPLQNLAKNDIIYVKYSDALYKRLFNYALSKSELWYSSFEVKTEIINLRDKCLGTYDN